MPHSGWLSLSKPAASTTGYTVRVAGHLDDHRAAWLGDWYLHRDCDGTTTLTADPADQAQLHGLLDGLRDLGATLITVSSTHQEPPSPTLPRTIATRRLVLRPATPGDADATWEYRRLPSVGEWITAIPSDLESYRLMFTEPKRLADAVIVEHGGRIIGDLMLRIEDSWAQAEAPQKARRKQAELGWVLDPAHTGRGFATEAVEALIEECFTNLGVRRVTAVCFLANTASWRLMERLGMRREQHAVRDSLHRSGQWLDSLTYAILTEEWHHR